MSYASIIQNELVLSTRYASSRHSYATVQHSRRHTNGHNKYLHYVGGDAQLKQQPWPANWGVIITEWLEEERKLGNKQEKKMLAGRIES